MEPTGIHIRKAWQKPPTIMDKFVCVVIKPLYFLTLIIFTAVTHLTLNKYSMYYAQLLSVSIVIFFILMLIVYFASKKIRDKNFSFPAERASTFKKILFLVASFLVWCATIIFLNENMIKW